MSRFDPARLWYGQHPLALALLPLSALFCTVVAARRAGFRHGWLHSERLPVPVIVVGNLSVGGTGKTPVVLALARLLRAQGWHPGILTRGYGGLGQDGPQPVLASSDPAVLGDEPVLLARRSGCPVIACPDRVAAGRFAIEQSGCDLLLTDDGLQHYRLARDLEIVVVDAARGFGNGHCLPAGPLREPLRRLRSVDLVLYNGVPQQPAHVMRLEPGAAVSLRDPQHTRPLASFRGEPLCAVAGIGNPQRFFAMLREHGLQLDACPYPDHHAFSAEDVASWPAGAVLMTEKDAVKCTDIATADCWYVPVEAVLDPGFVTDFLARVTEISHD